MIDEKKLIEKLKEWADSVPPFERDIIIDVIGFVEEQPKIGEWTPCSERLPDTKDSYLVTHEVKATKERFVSTSTFANKWNRILDFCNVVAWQPKPEPWRGE